MTMIDVSDGSADTQQRNRRLIFSTAMVMIIFAVTKGISLLQTFIIARYFGVGRDLDAYVTANRIPELIVVLISGGALGYAFIPIFSAYLAKEDTKGGWRLASHVINVVLLVAIIISVIVFFLTPWLVPNVIASGFSPETTAQTVHLMRILLIGTVIFAVSSIFSGILQSHNAFLLPALAPIMYDLGILFGVVFLLRPMGLQGVAIGAVLGASLHLLIQVPGLIRYRMRWTAELGLNNPDLRRVLRLMLPRVIGLGVFQLNFLIKTNIASRLGEGAISAIDWGWRLMQIPQTLIGTAMGIVIFPTLATLSAQGDQDGKRDAMSGALRFILIASIPSAIGLIVVGRPLISLLEGGAFDATASALVYTTLRAYMLGLIVHSMLEVVARSFYADRDTFTPLLVALSAAAINLALSVILSDIRTADSYQTFRLVLGTTQVMGKPPIFGNVAGLALANSLATAYEVVVLLVILRRRWHSIHETQLASTTAKTIVASLVMALAILGIELAWSVLGLDARGQIFTVVLLGLQVGLGGIVFTIVALVLNMGEVREILGLIRDRLRPARRVTA
jgi:putative peptidoglycan lipid II flippase